MRKDVFRYLFAILLVLGLASCDNGGPGKDNFVVTFDLDGGNIEGNDASVEITVKSGETIAVLPSPQKGTDKFDGWFSEKNGGGTQFTSGTVITSNLTVYAKWWVSEYAGTWVSNQYLARIIINGDLTFIQQGKENDLWENIAKGNLVISGTDVTMTVTHKYIGGTEEWSDSQSDLDSIKGYFGGKLVLTGTVTGSADGSIMLGHMVKNGTSSYNTGSLTISGLEEYAGKYIFAIAPLASGMNHSELFAADIFDSDETFSNGLIGDGGAITLNVYQRKNEDPIVGYNGDADDDKIDGRIDILILSKPTLSLTDISDVLPIFMSNPNTTEAEKTAAAESIGLLSLLSHGLENGTPFEDGAYNIGSDWRRVDINEKKVVITANVYQDETTTLYTGSVAEITARTVNPENTDETIKELGIVGSIKDGVLTIELPAELDDSFLYTDVEGTVTGVPAGSKIGWVMFSPYLVFNKYWDDWGNNSDWMGTMPFYISNNDNRGWFYTMNPTDYPDDAFTKPISDQDELIADGFYWQIREE